MGISIIEFIPLLLVICIWFGGFGLLFWMLWRILRAVERVAENTETEGVKTFIPCSICGHLVQFIFCQIRHGRPITAC